MKKIIFILLFIPVFISAQNFSYGFDAEVNYIRVNNGSNSNVLPYETLLPVTLNIIFSYNMNNGFSLRTRAGQTIFSSEFTGFEFGFDGVYKLNKEFYFSAGILHHSNIGNGDSSIHDRDTYTALYMLNAGFGYNIFNNFALEVGYFYPLKKTTIVSYNSDIPLKAYYLLYNFAYMLRLNFVFNWPI